MFRKIILTLLGSFLLQQLLAQSVYAPLNSDYYHTVERYEIKYGKAAYKMQSNVRPYKRKYIAALTDSVAQLPDLSAVDQFNLQYLRNDNWEWTEQAENDAQKPVFNTFYKKKSDFYHVQTKDFDLHVNPVIHFSVGNDNNSDDFTYTNTRGVEVRGMIDNKIGFYSYFTDTQASFPRYVQDFIRARDAVPGEGFYKDGDTAEPTDVDFLTARGYITFKATKSIDVQFGHDRNFIGNGYRSMILSDFSNNYLFLKLNTNIWKLNYQNIFAQMTAETFEQDGLRPKKYLAHHHLGVNITENLNIGIFESIVFGQRDTITNNTFDLNYLNPIILYRSVEQQLGSPDNALLGIDFRWNFLQRFQLYGQFVIDEFRIQEVINANGWWGNKQAGQIGFKYINVLGVSNLDLQLEANIARPYTYTQENNFKSYTHYNQPLAHPFGANFYEGISIVRYQPLKRLSLVGKLIYTRYGADDGENRGGNIFLDNRTRPSEFGNTMLQGIETNVLFADFTATYQLIHNLFVDFKQVVREVEVATGEAPPNARTSFTSLSVRWNIPQRLHEF
ncbi:MAG: hypothetical protein ACFB0B_06880 [Thermonemataceae bacterium]